MFARCDDVPAGTSGKGEGKPRQDDDGLDYAAPFDVGEAVVLECGDGEQAFEEFPAGFEAAGERHGVKVALSLVGEGAEEGEVVAEDVDGKEALCEDHVGCGCVRKRRYVFLIEDIRIDLIPSGTLFFHSSTSLWNAWTFISAWKGDTWQVLMFACR